MAIREKKSSEIIWGETVNSPQVGLMWLLWVPRYVRLFIELFSENTEPSVLLQRTNAWGGVVVVRVKAREGRHKRGRVKDKYIETHEWSEEIKWMLPISSFLPPSLYLALNTEKVLLCRGAGFGHSLEGYSKVFLGMWDSRKEYDLECSGVWLEYCVLLLGKIWWCPRDNVGLKDWTQISPVPGIILILWL